MSTKNNPGKWDCYANAEPDEPMFILLARDKHAPCLVWLWSVLRELDQEDPEKVAEAKQHVVDMIEWAAARGKKPLGMAACVLGGVFEMIRVVNHYVGKEAKNEMTDVEFVRMLLAETKVDPFLEKP